MNALAAFSSGMGIGLASFGGLWLTIRYALRVSPRRMALTVGTLLRLGLAVAAFYAVSREGAGMLLISLIGFLATRWILIRDLGNMSHGR